jgi:hypothetical protein
MLVQSLPSYRLFSEVYIEMSALAVELARIAAELAAKEAEFDAQIARIRVRAEEEKRKTDILFEKALATHSLSFVELPPGTSFALARRQAHANINALHQREPGASASPRRGGRRHTRVHKRTHKRAHKRVHTQTHRQAHRR